VRGHAFKVRDRRTRARPRAKSHGPLSNDFSTTHDLSDASPVEIGPHNGSKRPAVSSILVVDDETASGELVAALLQSQGYSVRLVGDGREAVRIVAGGEVDLLVCDLMMAKMDGVEVCSYVRNQLRDLVLPIVITTSLNDRESRIRAKEAGADDVIVKPIDGLELLVRLECLLRARAHFTNLVRERDRALAELTAVRAELSDRHRTMRDVEDVGDTMRALVESQWRAIELARKRWSNVGEARESLSRLAEVTAELSQCVETLARKGGLGAASSEGSEATAEGRAPAVSATK